jgi:hypothetical protein
MRSTVASRACLHSPLRSSLSLSLSLQAFETYVVEVAGRLKYGVEESYLTPCET